MAGSLRQRGKTSWQLRVLAGRDEITGKKSYVSKTFRGGRREAERELARLVAEVEAGSTTAAAGTVAELCNKWFEYACPNLSPAVSAEYRRLLDRRILPRWGSTPRMSMIRCWLKDAPIGSASSLTRLRRAKSSHLSRRVR